MTSENASPVCYADQGGDAYMGYAEKDEILALLNELLEAERAGTRVALVSYKAARDPVFRTLMKDLRNDEAHWCAMLSGQIKRLGGVPSGKTGAFYQKALAVSDMAERVSFVNRGQAWVVRKLAAFNPRVRDDSLHADLHEMQHCHQVNIDHAASVLSAKDG